MYTNKNLGLENSPNNTFNISEDSEKNPFKKDLLTREETAKYFAVDLSTLHNWKKKRVLIPVGIGGRVYYRMSDIEKALTPLN